MALFRSALLASLLIIAGTLSSATSAEEKGETVLSRLSLLRNNRRLVSEAGLEIVQTWDEEIVMATPADLTTVSSVSDLKDRFIPLAFKAYFPDQSSPYDCVHYTAPASLGGRSGVQFPKGGRDEKYRIVLGYKADSRTYPGYQCVSAIDPQGSPKFAFADQGTGDKYVVEHMTRLVVKG